METLLSKATRRLTALMTIEYGTPKKPATCQKGDDFDCPVDDAPGLILRGIAVPAQNTAPGSSPQHAQTPVDIPPNYQQSLSADELVDLARKLGAKSDVNRKDEAVAFIDAVVAERTAAANG